MIKKTFLITGINGQDGCFLAKSAIESGYEVVGVQREPPSYRSEQVVYRLIELGVYDKIKFEIVELENLNNVENLIKKYQPEYLVHLASQSSVEKSLHFENLTKQSNILISKNIIDSIEKYSKETVFFFPSSATIFEGYSDLLVDENTTPKPLSNYSISKFKTQNYIAVSYTHLRAHET